MDLFVIRTANTLWPFYNSQSAEKQVTVLRKNLLRWGFSQSLITEKGLSPSLN